MILFSTRGTSFKDETTRIINHLETAGIQRISFFSLFIPEPKVMFEHMGRLLAKSGRQFFTAVNVQPGSTQVMRYPWVPDTISIVDMTLALRLEGRKLGVCHSCTACLAARPLNAN